MTDDLDPIEDDEHDDHPAAPDPWDRFQATGETAKAYAAFLAYRNLPPAARTARQVVPLVYGMEYTEDHPRWESKLGQVQHWMATHLWTQRCSAYDQYQADTSAAYSFQNLIAMRDRHATIAQTAIRKAVVALQAFGDNLEMRDIIRLLDLGLKTERLARGDNDRVTLTHQGQDGGPITVQAQQNPEGNGDQLREVVAILSGAGAFRDVPDVKEAVDAYIAGEGADPTSSD